MRCRRPCGATVLCPRVGVRVGPRQNCRVPPGLPDVDVRRVKRWCDERVPEHVRHEIRVECDVDDRHLTIVEVRRPFDPQYGGSEWTRFPVARLRYTKARKEWTLYWRDRHLRFHVYDLVEPTASVNDLLDEIDRDPTCIFWG
jgi:hypothetical protein